MYRWEVAGNRPLWPAVRAGKHTASSLTLPGSLSLLPATLQLSVGCCEQRTLESAAAHTTMAM